MVDEDVEDDSWDDEYVDKPCPVCDNADYTCAHCVVSLNLSENVIDGGRCYETGQKLIAALENAMDRAAHGGTIRAEGDLRKLLEVAQSYGATSGTPEDVLANHPWEFGEYLTELLEAAPDMEWRNRAIQYGGFAAEDSGVIYWSWSPVRVETYLVRHAADADGSVDTPPND